MKKLQELKEGNTKLGLILGCISKAVKRPSFWLVLLTTYMLWNMAGMRYSSNQNFDIMVTLHHYILFISGISILTGVISYHTKLNSLVMAGAAAVLLSIFAIITNKVGIVWLGYGVGYYLLTPPSIFLFLWQIKTYICFAYCNYREVSENNNISPAINDTNFEINTESVLEEKTSVKKPIGKRGKKKK
jgi:hypothetical protein